MNKFIWILLFCIMSLGAFADCPTPDDVNFDPMCDDTDVPIDDGLWFLIAAGTVYSIKSIQKNDVVIDPTPRKTH